MQGRKNTMCDFAARQRQKEAARLKDEQDLRDGTVSRDELKRRNGLFSGLEIVSSSMITREDFS